MARPDRLLLAGLMGWPVMHSRSPLLHNFWFGQQGLAGTYLPLAIRPDGLEAALRALAPLGFSGCNLTIPHKSRAMSVMDEVDDVARRIGAISCVVVREDGSLFGTNNDWRGFLGSLRESWPDWSFGSGPAVVIGGGGGARAIVHALVSAGAPVVRVVNRTREKAEAIRDSFDGPIEVVDWDLRHEVIADAAIVVNATSQGMAGMPALDLDLGRLSPAARVSDIIYIPAETPFLAQARRRGNPTLNGLGMLLHQGPPAWKLWFGVEPTVTPELRRIMEESIAAG